MAIWSRPVIDSLLLLSMLTQIASFDDYALRMLGVHGKNYNLTKSVPWIGCMQWSTEKEPMEVQCNSTNFFGKKLGCQGLVRVKPESFKKYSRREESEEVVIGEDDYDMVVGKCWNQGEVEHKQCLHDEQCIAEVDESSEYTRGFAFCCCNTHYCNGKLVVRFKSKNGTSDVPSDSGSLLNDTLTTTPAPEPHSSALSIVLIVVASIFLCPVALLVISYVHFRMRRQRNRKTAEEAPLVEMGLNDKKRIVIKQGLSMSEMIAQGKMGRVHKATYKNPTTGQVRTVAVKTIQEEKSFRMEEAVYLMCENKHEHLVHYIGSNVDGKFVVLEHHERGCLENFLKRETFTPFDALSFLCSLMDGIAFLHSPVHEVGTTENIQKKAIVHRDIKSRNVLVKDDGTAALADFGLAIPVIEGDPQGRRWQVGTHRYMSPEMLAEKANLNMEGLKKVDVYATALIIWEVLVRTVVDKEDDLQVAQLPYSAELEEEVAAAEEKYNRNRYSESDVFKPAPIQYYLKAIVHQQNKRPVVRPKLQQNSITYELVKTALDMWDFEVDGRISAACAHLRLRRMIAELAVGNVPM